ncbi:hypothetical protein [Roseibium aggregatum]|uniref:Uncharacterized protein n=1 Tax=Roseibium aggregatum TaxID=187304 RepID=A0A939EJI2_9HYPH|nr:hypothetical protein [Roseibium aggregatum]MBN9674103.1 hypothetical protein [Roseibium aggregatum]
MKAGFTPFKNDVPETKLEWIERSAFWLFSNVIWSFIPLLFTLFFTLAIGLVTNISNEFRVAATIVAVTLCGTQLVDDIAIPDRSRTIWKWIKFGANIVLVLGTVVMIINVLHDRLPSGIKVSVGLTNLGAISVFVLALVLSFFGYVLKTKAGAESYEDSEDSRREDLIEDADSQSMVDGIKI